MKLTRDKKQIETLAGLLIILGALIYLGLLNFKNEVLQLSANTIVMGIIGIVIGVLVLVFAFKE